MFIWVLNRFFVIRFTLVVFIIVSLFFLCIDFGDVLYLGNEERVGVFLVVCLFRRVRSKFLCCSFSRRV